jgi:hypothetical protein
VQHNLALPGQSNDKRLRARMKKLLKRLFKTRLGFAKHRKKIKCSPKLCAKARSTSRKKSKTADALIGCYSTCFAGNPVAIKRQAQFMGDRASKKRCSSGLKKGKCSPDHAQYADYVVQCHDTCKACRVRKDKRCLEGYITDQEKDEDDEPMEFPDDTPQDLIDDYNAEQAEKKAAREAEELAGEDAAVAAPLTAAELLEEKKDKAREALVMQRDAKFDKLVRAGESRCAK